MISTIIAGFLAWAVTACSPEQPVPGTTRTGNDSTVRSQPKIPTFSGTRAFTHLVAQTALGPRNPNSEGHEQCLAYLQARLRESADRVRLQQFTHPGYEREILHLTNIMASFSPEMQQRILVCAHWDTRPRAEGDPDSTRRGQPIPGANDGASGVAVLLELASLLKATPPSIGVDILLFDGEDYGREGDHDNYLLGSRYFMANTPSDYLPRYGILIDMVGDRELEILQEATSLKYAPRVVDRIWNAAEALGIHQFVPMEGIEILDDHIPLNEGGIPTVNIIDFNYPDASHRYWHTHLDTPDKCSPVSLEAVGTVLTYVIYSERP
jgi:hypothetical protein